MFDRQYELFMTEAVTVNSPSHEEDFDHYTVVRGAVGDRDKTTTEAVRSGCLNMLGT